MTRRFQMAGEILRVTGPGGKLVGIDDRDGIKRMILKSPFHGVESKLMQPAPSKRPRSRMDHGAVTFERESVIQ